MEEKSPTKSTSPKLLPLEPGVWGMQPRYYPIHKLPKSTKFNILIHDVGFDFESENLDEYPEDYINRHFEELDNKQLEWIIQKYVIKRKLNRPFPKSSW